MIRESEKVRECVCERECVKCWERERERGYDIGENCKYDFHVKGTYLGVRERVCVWGGRECVRERLMG